MYVNILVFCRKVTVILWLEVWGCLLVRRRLCLECLFDVTGLKRKKMRERKRVRVLGDLILLGLGLKVSIAFIIALFSIFLMHWVTQTNKYTLF